MSGKNFTAYVFPVALHNCTLCTPSIVSCFLLVARELATMIGIETSGKHNIESLIL